MRDCQYSCMVFVLTLIVALRGKISRTSDTEGIVMASDTQVTSDLKQSMQKIFQLSNLPVLVGGAGSVSLSRHTIFRLEKLFQDFRDELGREMTCEDFDLLVNSDVEFCLREIVKSHSDIIKSSQLGFVLGFSDANNVRLYQVQSDGVPMRMDANPGYCCIGIGYSTGGSLLIQQYYSDELTLYQLMVLASYMIYEVARVDPSVGSWAQIMLNFGGKVAKPTEDIVKERLKLRSETMKKTWKLLENEDKIFERNFCKALGKKKLREFIRRL